MEQRQIERARCQCPSQIRWRRRNLDGPVALPDHELEAGRAQRTFEITATMMPGQIEQRSVSRRMAGDDPFGQRTAVGGALFDVLETGFPRSRRTRRANGMKRPRPQGGGERCAEKGARARSDQGGGA